MSNSHPIRRLLSFLAATLLTTLLFSQQRWERTYQNGTYSDDIPRIVQTANGDYLAYMLSKETSASPEFRYIARMGTNGEMLELDTSVQTYAGYPYPNLFPLPNGKTRVMTFWEIGGNAMPNAYFTPGFQHVWNGAPTVPFVGVPAMVDDTTFVVARKFTGGIKTMKVTISGNVLWTNEEPSAALMNEPYQDIAVTVCPDGGYFVAAFVRFFPQGASRLVTIKYSSDGTKQWSNWEINSGSIPEIAAFGDACYVLNWQDLRKYDANGQLLWSKNMAIQLTGYYWGAAFPRDLAIAHDGGLVLTGRTASNIDGASNIFLAKISAEGDKIWMNEMGYDNLPEDAFAIQTTPDHGFLITAKRWAAPNLPSASEAWLIKTDSAGNNGSNLVTGRLVNDLDDDCVADPGEPGLSNHIVRAIFDAGELYRVSDSSGTVTFPVGEGATLLQISLDNNPYEVACLETIENFDLSVFDSVVYELPVGLIECPLMNVDLGASQMRPCSTAYYFVHYCNEGTSVAENANIQLFLNQMLELTSADLPYTSPEPGLYLFQLGDLQAGECGDFSVTCEVSCDAEIGDEVCSTVTAEPDTICIESPVFYYDPPFWERTCVTVQNSYDPNDKIPLAGTPTHIGLDSTLKYQIRFQNTGNDLAYNIVIRDTLSPHLEPLSFQPGASSHPCRWEVGDNGTLKFIFEDILLPDSASNEPGSHGFVQFKIRQRPSLARNTPIENRAGIYFDFNPPILTNTTHQLVDYPDHLRYDSLTLCAGQAFNNVPVFADTVISQIVFYPTFDSVITMSIEVLPAFEVSLDTSLAFGSLLGDIPVFAEGNYEVVLQAENGCDSTLHIYAFVTPTSSSAFIAGDKSPCQFAMVNYGVPLHPDAFYSWEVTGGDLISGEGTHLISVHWTGNQIGNISLTILLDGTLIPIDPVFVTILPNEFTHSLALAHPPCFGEASGSIDLTLDGAGSPFSFLWSNGMTAEDLANLPAGTYSVTMSAANGCTQIAEATVTEPPAFDVQVSTVQPTEGQSDGSISIVVGGAAPPYSLDWGNGVFDNPLEGLPEGSYTFILTDAKGCVFTQTIVLEGVTANEEAMAKYELTLSPNPVSDKFELHYRLPEAAQVSIEVVNSLGQKVAVPAKEERQAMGEHRYFVKTGEWQAGVYFVHFLVEGKHFGLRLVKN